MIIIWKELSACGRPNNTENRIGSSSLKLPAGTKRQSHVIRVKESGFEKKGMGIRRYKQTFFKFSKHIRPYSIAVIIALKSMFKYHKSVHDSIKVKTFCIPSKSTKSAA